MLSKSQAKAFFLTGTVAFSAIFVGLTIDTFNRIPDQTRAQNLTQEVIRGKHIYERKNCMGCHTILGEGAYYAPELTKVYQRRGETFIKTFLKDPEAMYPGQRKMINYHFVDSEIQDLVAFLKWIGEIDLNGFPPKPELGSVANVVASSANNSPGAVGHLPRPQMFNQLCIACHSLQGQGGKVGPALDGVGSRLDLAYLQKWIKDPKSIKSDTKMPTLPLSDQDISDLALFLADLKGVQ